VRLFDTHCHLDDEQFSSDRDAVVARAIEAGLEHIVAVGTTAGTSAACVGLSEEYEVVLAAVGIQPNYVAEAAGGDWEVIESLVDRPTVVAIGETGLDRYWDQTPFALQRDYFDRHIRLSQKTGLPFIVHMRDCDSDVLEMLDEAHRRGPLRGVMHSFTGTQATASRCLELGLYISFAGMVTYKKSTELRAIAEGIPADRLLIETDAPYLSPHPHRGQRPNEPSLVAHTATCLAEARGESAESLAEQTTMNARRLFGLESG
jgi:TatD DNase family protein